MANAETTAPLPTKTPIVEMVEVEGFEGEKVKKGSNEENALLSTLKYDTLKKYMFQLADEAPEPNYPVIEVSNAGRTNIPLSKQQFIKQRNIILSSQIIWNGARRNIRYYDGCTTLFVDKQPQDKAMIEQLIAQTNKNKFIFREGKWGCDGYEKLLLLYMNIASWNAGSPFRTKTANAIFKSIDPSLQAISTASKIDKMEEALKLAREASGTKMRIHSAYLGIYDKDYDSGNELTEPEIKALYREYASKNPEYFIDTFGNTAIEIQHYIQKSWEKGDINNKSNPNIATWGSKNTKICDISGLRSPEAICNRIFEFSQTEEGAEFKVQLKALYS